MFVFLYLSTQTFRFVPLFPARKSSGCDFSVLLLLWEIIPYFKLTTLERGPACVMVTHARLFQGHIQGIQYQISRNGLYLNDPAACAAKYFFLVLLPCADRFCSVLRHADNITTLSCYKYPRLAKSQGSLSCRTIAIQEQGRNRTAAAFYRLRAR